MREEKTSLRCDRDIQSAKHYLIRHRNMTEAEAHRYLQKMSMDAGRSITETARMVLLFSMR